MIDQIVRRPNGLLNLAVLVPNAGGYEPDPIKRIHGAYGDIRLPERREIDVAAVIKKVPEDYRFTTVPDYQFRTAAQTGYGSSYGEF